MAIPCAERSRPHICQDLRETSITRLRLGSLWEPPSADRQRMLGGVGAGGENPPATRLAFIPHFNVQSKCVAQSIALFLDFLP